MDFKSISREVSFSTEINKNEDCLSLQNIISENNLYTQDNFYLRQYGDIVDRYLQKKGPHLFVPTTRRCTGTFDSGSSSTGKRLEDITSGLTAGKTASASTWSSPSHTMTPRQTTASVFANMKINILARINIIEREIDENKIVMEKLRKKFNSANFLLKAEQENLHTDLDAVEENRLMINRFVAENIEDKKKLVNHDKFLKFLENQLENKDREWGKLRLLTKALETDYSRIKSQQERKLELQEHLHAIDIIKLDVENQKQLELLEQRTNHLKNLKKTIGRKGQTLISVKSKLNDSIAIVKNMKKDQTQKEAKMVVYEKKETQDVSKLRTAELLHGHLKRLNDNFKSPDVRKYMEVEAALSEVKKEKDRWEKRCLNAKQTICLLEHQVRQTTPSAISTKSLHKTKSLTSNTRLTSFLINPGKANCLSLKFL